MAERKPFVLGEVVEETWTTIVAQDEEQVLVEEGRDCTDCGRWIEPRYETKVTPHPDLVGQRILTRTYSAAVRQACVEWIDGQRREGFKPRYGDGIAELSNGARRPKPGVDLWPWADTEHGGDCWLATVQKVIA